MMDDFDAAQVLGSVIHDALDPKGNDYQREARAVIAAIQADTQMGAKLRKAIAGFGPAPALWDRLDKTAPTSAQNIEWYAPHTAELIHSEHVAEHARRMAETVKDPDEIALWLAIANELAADQLVDHATDKPAARSITATARREDRFTNDESGAALFERRRGEADDS